MDIVGPPRPIAGRPPTPRHGRGAGGRQPRPPPTGEAGGSTTGRRRRSRQRLLPTTRESAVWRVFHERHPEPDDPRLRSRRSEGGPVPRSLPHPGDEGAVPHERGRGRPRAARHRVLLEEEPRHLRHPGGGRQRRQALHGGEDGHPRGAHRPPGEGDAGALGRPEEGPGRLGDRGGGLPHPGVPEGGEDALHGGQRLPHLVGRREVA